MIFLSYMVKLIQIEYYFSQESKFIELYKEIKIFEYFNFTPKKKSELKKAINFYVKNRKNGISRYGIMNKWNTSLITDMSELFESMEDFNEPIGNWDTSNVTTMKSMFLENESFNQPLNKWNTSNVIDMSEMFFGAENFNQPLDNWDTSNVTDMSFMFCYNVKFNQNINNWNTSNVRSMKSMFSVSNNFVTIK